MSTAANHPAEWDRAQRIALVVMVAGLLLCAVGALVSREQFFRSYLVAFLFWIGTACGCLAIVMLQHLTGGAWGLVIRRLLEAATRCRIEVGLPANVHNRPGWTHEQPRGCRKRRCEQDEDKRRGAGAMAHTLHPPDYKIAACASSSFFTTYRSRGTSTA